MNILNLRENIRPNKLTKGDGKTFTKENIKIGISPIGWTNDDMPELGGDISFEQCISDMARSRYDGCEVGSKYPKEPDAILEALDSCQLIVASQWFSAYFTTKELNHVLDDFTSHVCFLEKLGAKVVVLSEQGHSIQGKMDAPLFENKPKMNQGEWESLCEGLESAGEIALKHGMKLVYHHHMGTVVQTKQEIDHLMENTNPRKVWLLLDTGHLFFSGESPLDVIKDHGSRIAHVHLKDIRSSILEKVKQERLSFLQSVKAGVFTVPGDGIIEFGPILRALEEIGYQGWFIVEAEQDPKIANPLEYASKAREYIKSLIGF